MTLRCRRCRPGLQGSGERVSNGGYKSGLEFKLEFDKIDRGLRPLVRLICCLGLVESVSGMVLGVLQGVPALCSSNASWG